MFEYKHISPSLHYTLNLCDMNDKCWNALFIREIVKIWLVNLKSSYNIDFCVNKISCSNVSFRYLFIHFLTVFFMSSAFIHSFLNYKWIYTEKALGELCLCWDDFCVLTLRHHVIVRCFIRMFCCSDTRFLCQASDEPFESGLFS